MIKDEILKKIEPLFYDKTFKEVSMQEIANHLWIKKASLYYYYKSKEDLQEDLINYSYENYKKFILSIINKDLKIFIERYISYPYKSQNIFSLINQIGYCENEKIKKYISTKQQELIDIIKNDFKNKYWFNEEKIFILLSIIENISKKKCIFWWCPYDLEKIIDEILILFNS